MKTLKYAWAQLGFRDRLALVAILLLGSSLAFLDLAGIALVGLTVTLASGNASSLSGVSERLVLFVSQLGVQNAYAIFAAGAVMFFCLKTGISLFVVSRNSRYLATLEARKGAMLFRQVINGDVDQFSNWTENQIVFGVTASTTSTFNKAFTAIFAFITEFILLVTIACYLASVNLGGFLGLLAFFGLLSLALYVFVVRLNGKLSTEAMRTSLTAGNLVYESMANFRQIYASGQAANFVKRFSSLRMVSAQASAKMSLLTLASRYVTEISLMLGLAALIVQRSLPNAEKMPASVISIFVVGALRIIASLIPLQGHLTTLKQVDGESETAMTLGEAYNLSQPRQAPTERPIVSSLELNHPVIEMKEVGYIYRGEADAALKDVSISIKYGEFIAVVGKSGSGKSTFADLLLGLRKPTAGKIEICGIPPKTVVSEHPGVVAYVPQATRLVSGTVIENITLNFEGQFDLEQLERAVSLSNLSEFVNSLPEKMNTKIGPQVRDLSGGQTQRIGLARAMYLGPKILILDEATSALDEETEAHISSALAELRGELTLVVIAHRVSTLKAADRVAKFEAGTMEIFNSFDEMQKALNEKSVTVEEEFGVR